MNRTPAYFRGEGKVSHQYERQRRRKPRLAQTGILSQRQFFRQMLLGLVAATAVSLLSVWGYQEFASGGLGVWPSWHGETWTTAELVDYLGHQGALFEDVPSLDYQGVVQLRFDGYEERVQAVQDTETEDLRTKMFREENLKRAINTVYVVRQIPGVSGSDLATADLYGSHWSWGYFTFRGDSARIAEIQAILR